MGYRFIGPYKRYNLIETSAKFSAALVRNRAPDWGLEMKCHSVIRIMVFVMVILAGICPIWVHGADLTHSYSSRINPLPAWIDTGWVQYQSERSGGRFEEAAKTRERIQKQAIGEGIERFDLLAATLIREGEQALSEGRRDEALELGQEARKWSPGYPSPSFFLASASSFSRPMQAVRYYIGGLAETYHDFWASFYWLGRLVLILSMGIIGGSLLFVVFLFIRYFPLLAHNISELGLLNHPAIWGLIILLLVLPLVLGIGPGIVLMIGIGLVWFFMSSHEHFIASAFVLLFSLSFLWMSPLLSWFTADELPELVLMADVRQGSGHTAGYPPSMEPRARKNKDAHLLITLGLQNKHEGKYSEALDFYEAARKAIPGESLIYNNVGNVRFLMRDYDGAVGAYEEALRKNPNNVTTHYNLNVVYRELLRFEEARQEYDRAQAINRGLTQAYARRGKVVIDQMVPSGILWERAFANTPSKTERSERLFKYLMAPLSLNRSPWLLAIALAILGLGRLILPPKHVSSRCSLCAQPICLHCQRRVINQNLS